MKDFPMFTTQYGVASLVLREIPTRGEAYITVRSSQDTEKLLEECVSFCRACGAEKIYDIFAFEAAAGKAKTVALILVVKAVVNVEVFRSLLTVSGENRQLCGGEQAVFRYRAVKPELKR